jgi:hypothetical protein
MGRQIAVVLGKEDESRLLDFLRSRGAIRLLESFAPSPEALFCETFAPLGPGHFSYHIWLTGFPWSPKFRQTITESGLWYASNKGDAPLVEYERFNPDSLSTGRFYWSDRFSGEPKYDRIVFGREVDALWRWVRKEARRIRLPNNDEPWCFPSALNEFGLKI